MQKTPRASKSRVNPAASAGPNGIAVAPPAYGIESVDRQFGQSHQLSEAAGAIQLQAAVSAAGSAGPGHTTGPPDHLKAGIEGLSGLPMDDVHVHYNSAKPAQLQALAYTQGSQIHIGPGQQRHLPHEAWHVVQQKQGRVRPTLQLKGAQVNDDAGLEHEADVMGMKAARHTALQMKRYKPMHMHDCACPACASSQPRPIQRLKTGSTPGKTIQRLTIGDDVGETSMDAAASHIQGQSTRSTTAIAERDNDNYIVYAQATTNGMQGRIGQYNNLDTGALAAGTGFHAEVVALQASTDYTRVAASQAICARCEALLNEQGIGAVNTDGHFTRLWSAPWDNDIDEDSPYPYGADGGGGNGLNGTRWGFDTDDDEEYEIAQATWRATHPNGW